MPCFCEPEEGGGSVGDGVKLKPMAEEREERNGPEVVGRDGPPIVTIAGAGRAVNFPPPLKLEAEESGEGVNPSNMWQVFKSLS